MKFDIGDPGNQQFVFASVLVIMGFVLELVRSDNGFVIETAFVGSTVIMVARVLGPNVATALVQRVMDRQPKPEPQPAPRPKAEAIT